jgi:hypothetical protein
VKKITLPRTITTTIPRTIATTIPRRPAPPPLAGYYTEIRMPPKAAAANEPNNYCKWNEGMEDALLDCSAIELFLSMTDLWLQTEPEEYA